MVRASQPQAESARPNWVVIGGTLAVTVAATIWSIVDGPSFDRNVGAVANWLTGNLGWAYVGTVAIVMMFMLWLALSRAGNIKLGPDHAQPQYSLFSWSAMLFSAGIGLSLLFYSVAEPVAQYANPPVGEGESQEALREAVAWTLFHYGISGWALYALMGLAFAYYSYRLNMPLAIRSSLYPLIGKRINGRIGDAVDITAMLGTIFGIVASLGIGVMQINYGLNLLLGLPEGVAMQIALVSLSIGMAAISALSGLDKGIKRLSEFNVFFASILLFALLFLGRTEFLMNSLIKNMGDYLYKLPVWTFETFSYSNTPEATDAWMANWTLFFWAWWVAWAPLVGLFLARISRGRTFRQFIVGTLLVPFLYLALWASFLGNIALDRVLGGDREFLEITIESPERGFFMMLEGLPGAPILIALALIIAVLFFVTSADSGALVMATFSSHSDGAPEDGESKDGAAWMRVMWIAVAGILTVAMVQVGGLSTLQMATLVMGMPFMVVLFLIMIGLVRSIRRENALAEAKKVAFHAAMSGRATTGDVGAWRQRLYRADTWPSESDINTYLREVAQPALSEVTTILLDCGFQATLVGADAPGGDARQLALTVDFEGGSAFQYQLYPVTERIPDYALHQGDEKNPHYCRLEVFGSTGSLGFDAYGFTADQLIANVLDLFDQHREYLHMQKDISGEGDMTAYTRRAPRWEEDFG